MHQHDVGAGAGLEIAQPGPALAEESLGPAVETMPVAATAEGSKQDHRKARAGRSFNRREDRRFLARRDWVGRSPAPPPK